MEQPRKKTPMFASKNSLMQQAKIQEKPWKENVALRHSSAHLLCYVKCENMNSKNHVTTLNKTNVPDDIFLSHRPLQKTACERTVSNSVWRKMCFLSCIM